MKIPQKGLPWEAIAPMLDAAKADDFSWREGRMAVYYYFLDEALRDVQVNAYTSFWTENNLGKRAFPSLAKLENDIIAFALELMNAPQDAAGTFTSGGSESIFLALQTARDWARAEKGIREPNFVVPRTAHPGFSRAGHALGIDIRRVATTRNDFRADVAAMEGRIDDDTIGLVGSAPNYPFGVIDPIAEIAALAQKRGLWMHVDACVGGYLSPWVKRLGYALPDWDFSVPGVTSISADLHKYGMAPKGASTLLLHSEALKTQYQQFDFRDWERGQYLAYTMQGTRPGGAVAGAWAVLQHLGEDPTLRQAVDGHDPGPGRGHQRHSRPCRARTPRPLHLRHPRERSRSRHRRGLRRHGAARLVRRPPGRAAWHPHGPEPRAPRDGRPLPARPQGLG